LDELVQVKSFHS